MPANPALRIATPADALRLSVLATQVFLDTYATSGITNDLAKEALGMFSLGAVARRLEDAAVEIHVVEERDALIGFVDLDARSACPIAGIHGLEVARLYVQAPFHRRGTGRALMSLAASRAADLRREHVWLTAWSGNARALRFYESMGYSDRGATEYVIEGNAYENRVLVRGVVR